MNPTDTTAPNAIPEPAPLTMAEYVEQARHHYAFALTYSAARKATADEATKLAALERQVVTATSDLHTRRTEINAAENLLRKVRAEIVEAETKLGSVRRDAETATRKLRDAQAQLNALKSSLS